MGREIETGEREAEWVDRSRDRRERDSVRREIETGGRDSVGREIKRQEGERQCA